MTASIRDTLPPHRRAAWDRIWTRLLAPAPDPKTSSTTTDAAPATDEPADDDA